MDNDNLFNIAGKVCGWIFKRGEPTRISAASPAEAKPMAWDEEYAADEVVVKFKAPLDRLYSLAHIEKLSDNDNIHRFRLPQGRDVHSVIEELKHNPLVEYAQPNYKRQPANTIPNDVLFSQQWALTRIGAPQAWDLQKGDPTLVIAVVDSGADFNHPDLVSRLQGGWNFSISNGNGDANFMDTLGHGTPVTGIIGAATNNGIGVAGGNWNSKIMPIKMDFYDTSAAKAIRYAADNGARIINMSWGGYAAAPLLKDATDYAYSKGCILIGAAGNDGYNLPFYPAAFKNVISVAATDETDSRAIWDGAQSSNFAGWINIAAPGNNIYSTFMNNSFDYFLGTSAAAPVVSGVASLLVSSFPAYSNEEIRQLLMKSADEAGTAGWDKETGAGRVALFNALSMPGSGYQPSSAVINSPVADQFFQDNSIKPINGSAGSSIFSNFIIESGEGDEPAVWSTNAITLINNGQAPVSNGQLGSIDPAALNGNFFTVRLKTFDQQGNWAEDRVAFYNETMLKFNRSFPVTANSKLIGADFDRDGSTKVVLGSDHSISMVDPTGNKVAGWPQTDNNYYFLPPAIGDVNNDGELEVLTAASECSAGVMLYAWKRNGEALEGWPKTVSGLDSCEQFTGQPVLGDINNDGQLEIILSTNQGKLFLLDSNGNTLNGWPKQLAFDLTRTAIISLSGENRIVAGGGAQVHVLNAQGGEEPGWPQSVDLNVSALAVGDLENNGSQQIVVIGDQSATAKKVWVFNADGSIKNGWPVVINGKGDNPPSISIGDVDGDGRAEILISFSDYDSMAYKCTKNSIHVLDAAGNIKSGWPREIQKDCSQNNILVSDLNGDGVADLIYPAADRKVAVWNGSGTEVANWPRYTRSVNYGAAIFDTDGNGKKELLFATTSPESARQGLYVWEETAPSANAAAWPMWRHDAMNSGNLNMDTIPPVIEHEPITNAQTRLPIPISASITDNVMVRTARVFYKAMSSPAYQFAMLNNPSGSQWSGEIPRTAVMLEGMQYYIVAHDAAINPAVTPVYDIAVAEGPKDTNPPTISFDPITEGIAGIEQLLSAEVTDDLSGVQSVWLSYRHKKYGDKKIDLQLRENDLYSASIPAADMLEGVTTYSIGARDNDGNETQTAVYPLQVIKYQKSYGCGCN